MFGLFVNGEFKGFWSNKVGDVFFDNTCNKMEWDKSQTIMVHYQGMKESEIEHTLVSPNEVVIRNKVTNLVDSGELDENQQPIMIEQDDFVVVKTIQADLFVNNGVMLINC